MTQDDQTEYILQMARKLGIALPNEELVRIKAVFGNLERAAALVRDASLPDDTIAAAVFRAERGVKE
jgi:hypothetical protein